MQRSRQTISEEKFKTLLLEDKWISSFAYPVHCCDRKGREIGMHTCSYPIEYVVTPQMQQEALERAGERKRELLSSLKKGELAFVSMGGNYSSSIPDDVCNYRIRCNFRNSAGGRYFIEFVRSIDGGFYVDSAIDYGEDERFNALEREAIEWNRSHLSAKDRMPYPDQFQYNPFGVAKMQIGKPFTFANVLDFVNRKFGCAYTTGRLFRHFISWEEYENEC